MDIGKKIKRLRQEKFLTQDELAMRCELSKGFISQLERDLTSPSITTLIDILEGLGTNLRDFFNEDEDEKIVFKKEDVFESIDEELKYKIEWIVPNAQKNQMEPILITIEEGGRYKEELPHEGEEFGYVLSGTVLIHLGEKIYKARKGESFYYKSRKNHYISNAGKNIVKVLWVSNPPSF
ncbi:MULTISPECIES: helix-turn-helix domain-containing protein [Psychrilyobacter]|uniref:Cupin domain-containing protein n=1 Tax=Psychrilyobacter piezotolerans TaxID=2293438 RepID=A0ABX9KGF6_9FUSO|nr:MULTISPECIES: XRE family transcriptional regulator [Psychrilyobacter]MCS5422840.1 XRE family transcriptional regulator [Psychrilyobacter sp. S5]NDI78378.1 cupin domain-containing protein [Psychrilyobacter piezotolerans]RDE61105.1 cupin domain-containing protein [Psychrilyobacter sp. S5]REI40746.1 cupin domain-containing protein [Psychrilyobacter piezotolerans]